MFFLRPPSWLLSKLNNGVIRNTAIYTVASALNAAIPFFILPVLTSYLTPVEYGVVSTFMVLNSIFVIVLGLEQYSFISVNYYAQARQAIASYVTNIILNAIIVFFLVGAFILLFPSFFAELSQIDLKWVIVSIVVAFFQFLTQLSLTLWQLENKSMKYGLFQIFHSCANYGLSIGLIIFYSMAEAGRIFGIALAAILFGSYSFVYLLRKKLIVPKPSLGAARAALVFSLPLVPHAFAGWVNTALDRLIINHHVGIAENGLYSINYQIAMVVGLVASSFNRAFTPFIYKTLNTGDPVGKVTLVRYTYAYYVGLIALASLFVGISPFIFDILVADQYQQNRYVLFWIIVGFTADGLYYGVINYLFYAKKTIYISIVTFSSCLFHFVISFLLIPEFGMIAAAWSTAFSFLFSFALAFYMSNKFYPMPWLYFSKSKRLNLE